MLQGLRKQHHWYSVVLKILQYKINLARCRRLALQSISEKGEIEKGEISHHGCCHHYLHWGIPLFISRGPLKLVIRLILPFENVPRPEFWILVSSTNYLDARCATLRHGWALGNSRNIAALYLFTKHSHGLSLSLYQKLVLKAAQVGLAGVWSTWSILRQYNVEVSVEIVLVLAASRPIFLHRSLLRQCWLLATQVWGGQRALF